MVLTTHTGTDTPCPRHADARRRKFQRRPRVCFRFPPSWVLALIDICRSGFTVHENRRRLYSIAVKTSPLTVGPSTIRSSTITTTQRSPWKVRVRSPAPSWLNLKLLARLSYRPEGRYQLAQIYFYGYAGRIPCCSTRKTPESSAKRTGCRRDPGDIPRADIRQPGYIHGIRVQRV